MKRLTTDCATNNFEVSMNYVFGKDGWAHIVSDGEHENVPLTTWAKGQCIKRGCDEFPGETPEEIDSTLCDCIADGDGCPIALAYRFASQACHLRTRLKQYEDIGLTPDEIMGLCSMDKRAKMAELIRAEENRPLTLEQLREMNGEPIWVVQINKHTLFCDAWMIVTDYGAIDRSQSMTFCEYGKTWLAYRSKSNGRRCEGGGGAGKNGWDESMKKYFCDICGRELPAGETAFPSSCQKIAELCGLADICADCLPLAAGLDIQALLLDELRRRLSSLNDGADTGTPDPPIALKGNGAKEKRRILEGLKAYRTAHGLGSLRELSSRAKVPIENIQKMLLCENVPMAEWRKVAAALGIDKQ